MMKIYKEIEIDLYRYVKQLKNPAYNYTEQDKFKLNILYSDFADGLFESAYKYADTWTSEERELIPCEIWDILYDVSMGIKYKVENNL